jgi:hypothetical protein
MTPNEAPITTFYCIVCFKGNLPIGQTCSRLGRDGHRATCLKCCNHNHG